MSLNGDDPHNSSGPSGPSDLIPSIGPRVAARIIDWMIIFCIWAVVAIVVDDGDFPLRGVIWAVVLVAYETGFVYSRGRTIGKELLNLRIVSFVDGSSPSLVQALLRVLPVLAIVIVGAQFFAFLLVFLYFTAGFMDNARGVIDRLAGTAVVAA